MVSACGPRGRKQPHAHRRRCACKRCGCCWPDQARAPLGRPAPPSCAPLAAPGDARARWRWRAASPPQTGTPRPAQEQPTARGGRRDVIHVWELTYLSLRATCPSAAWCAPRPCQTRCGRPTPWLSAQRWTPRRSTCSTPAPRATTRATGQTSRPHRPSPLSRHAFRRFSKHDCSCLVQAQHTRSRRAGAVGILPFPAPGWRAPPRRRGSWGRPGGGAPSRAGARGCGGWRGRAAPPAAARPPPAPRRTGAATAPQLAACSAESPAQGRMAQPTMHPALHAHAM